VEALARQPWNNQIWELGVLVVIAIALIVNPQFWLTAIALVLSLFFARVLSVQWGRILQYFYPTSFNANEPLFNHDISLYVFSCWQEIVSPRGNFQDFLKANCVTCMG
jgi:hypothetical protein